MPETPDVALSRPRIATVTYGFGGPRIGNAAYADFYNDVARRLSRETLRLVLEHDPLANSLSQACGFRHVGKVFRITPPATHEQADPWVRCTPCAYADALVRSFGLRPGPSLKVCETTDLSISPPAPSSSATMTNATKR